MQIKRVIQQHIFRDYQEMKHIAFNKLKSNAIQSREESERNRIFEHRKPVSSLVFIKNHLERMEDEATPEDEFSPRTELEYPAQTKKVRTMLQTPTRKARKGQPRDDELGRHKPVHSRTVSTVSRG